VDFTVDVDLSRASHGFTIGNLLCAFLICHFPQENVSRGEGRRTWFGTGGYVYSTTGIRAS